MVLTGYTVQQEPQRFTGATQITKSMPHEKKTAIQLISTGGIYGAERALLELAGYLGDHGWESRVVALEGQGAGALAARALARGLPAEAFVPAGRLAVLPMLSRLKRLLERHSRAIVHSHGYKPDILLSILGVRRRLGCVATCHNWISETRKMQIWEGLDKRVLRGFDRVIAVSEEVRRKLIASGVRPEKTDLVVNGITPPTRDAQARRRIREELGVPADAALVAQVGRLARSKRNDLLLHAVARLKTTAHVHVVMAGEGEQRAALQALARNLELENRVHLCGYRSDVAEILAAADLLVLSSDLEAMPIVVLEAMGVRCPIVSTRVGEVPRILEQDLDGWLVPPGDVAALTAAVDEALSHPAVAQTRAERAYAKFLRAYSRDSMGAAYLRIYEEVWRSRGWPSGGAEQR